LASIPEVHVKYARRILKWVTFATLPLSLLDVSEAVAFQARGFDKDDVLVDPWDVVRICRGLLTTINDHACQPDEDSSFGDAPDQGSYRLPDGLQTVILTHYSVKECSLFPPLAHTSSLFSLDEAKGQASILRSCVLSLLRYPCPKYRLWKKKTFHSFDDYAIRCWAQHIVPGMSADESLRKVVEKFFTSMAARNMCELTTATRVSRTRERLAKLMAKHVLAAFKDTNRVFYSDKYRANKSRDPGLSYAIAMSWDTVVGCMVESPNVNINTVSTTLGSPLIVSALLGRLEYVELLIQHNADINLQAGMHGTALQAASYGGHLPVVKYLLNNRADPKSGAGELGCSLQAAAAAGRLGVIEELLKHSKLKVDQRRGFYGTAVQAASFNGNFDLLDRLIQVPADLNIRGGTFGTAIQAAAYHEDWNMVEYLLNNGADVNSHVRGGLSPRHDI
jgi:ankyrin repeat protein